MLTAVDLCCGAGGWAVAARGLPIRVIAAVDLAEDCALTYKYNHPDAGVICGDAVTSLNLRALRGRVDLVLGGIPCEQISVARNNKVLSEEDQARWHRLLDGALEIVDYLQPAYWCIENVMQMRRHLPPLTPYSVYDATLYGSAQARKRMFMGRYPEPTKTPGPKRTFAEVMQPGPYYLHKTAMRCGIYSNRQWYGDGVKRLLRPDRPSPTVTDCGTRNVRGFIVQTPDGRERVLQLTEAARLQGFPTDYVFVGAFSRAWKMVVQAIQIDMGRALLSGIVREAGQLAEQAQEAS